MTMARIRVLVVDDLPETLQVIKNMVAGDEEIEIAGWAANGDDALALAERLLPDVVLLDTQMAETDGLQVADLIARRCSRTIVVFTTLQADLDLFREAMRAGGRDVLVKPFTREVLTGTLRQVVAAEENRLASRLLKEVAGPHKGRNPQIVTIFSAKGGVGRTTLAVNLALALVRQYGKTVALVDADLELGDVAVCMNLIPKKTWYELAQEMEHSAEIVWEQYLTGHSSGVKVLAAPTRPEYAEIVQDNHVERVLRELKTQFDFIVVDTPPAFSGATLVALEQSSQILLLSALDLPTCKNTKLSLDVLESLSYKGKTKMLVNRVADGYNSGITVEDLESNLGFLAAVRLPADGRLVVASVNEGIPFVQSHPGAKVSAAVDEVAQLVVNDGGRQTELEEQRKKSLLKRWFRSR